MCVISGVCGVLIAGGWVWQQTSTLYTVTLRHCGCVNFLQALMSDQSLKKLPCTSGHVFHSVSLSLCIVTYRRILLLYCLLGRAASGGDSTLHSGCLCARRSPHPPSKNLHEILVKFFCYDWGARRRSALARSCRKPTGSGQSCIEQKDVVY